MNLRNFLMLGFLTAVAPFITGCNNPSDTAAPKATAPNAAEVGEASEDGHVHGEWWCSEHGMPEEICVQCDVTLAADYKAKGDWCEEHDRPDSQCFICHPEKKAEFAAQYEAKYGEQPPKPTAEDEGDEHEHDHDEDKAES